MFSFSRNFGKESRPPCRSRTRFRRPHRRHHGRRLPRSAQPPPRTLEICRPATRPKPAAQPKKPPTKPSTKSKDQNPAVTNHTPKIRLRCYSSRLPQGTNRPSTQLLRPHLLQAHQPRMSKVEMVDGARDYRLMTRQVVDAIISCQEYNRAIPKAPVLRRLQDQVGRIRKRRTCRRRN